MLFRACLSVISRPAAGARCGRAAWPASGGGTYSLRRRAGGRTTDPASDPKTRSSGSFPFETSFLGEKSFSPAANNSRGGMEGEQSRCRVAKGVLISRQRLLAVSRLTRLTASRVAASQRGSKRPPEALKSSSIRGETCSFSAVYSRTGRRGCGANAAKVGIRR